MATRLTLSDGETLVVEESYGEVKDKIKSSYEPGFFELTEHKDGGNVPVFIAREAIKFAREKQEDSGRQHHLTSPDAQAPSGGIENS